MNYTKHLQCVLYLVRLQVADHVPCQAHVRKLSVLGERFLNAVLTDVRDAIGRRVTDGLGAEPFADGDESNFSRRPPRPHAGAGDALSHIVQPVGEPICGHGRSIAPPRDIIAAVIISILTRHTRLTDRNVWEAALGTVREKIDAVLKDEPGFVSVQYLWGTDEPGAFAQITTWASETDARNYIRGGGAATVATIEDAAVPTAGYPNGNWVRQNYATID